MVYNMEWNKNLFLMGCEYDEMLNTIDKCIVNTINANFGNIDRAILHSNCAKMFNDIENEIVWNVAYFIDNNDTLLFDNEILMLIACCEIDFNVDYYYIDTDFNLHECDADLFAEFDIKMNKLDFYKSDDVG